MSKKWEPAKTDKFPLKKGVSKYNQQLWRETAFTTAAISKDTQHIRETNP